MTFWKMESRDVDGGVEALGHLGRAAFHAIGRGSSGAARDERFQRLADVLGLPRHGDGNRGWRRRSRRRPLGPGRPFGSTPVRTLIDLRGAKDFPGGGYGLVTIFDALHDMGDPIGAAAHVRRSLAPDGAFMLVEPNAADDLAGNLNPVGRMFYSASTMICTPASMSQEVALALGAQAGEARLKQVALEAGFTRFRRAVETPFNMVLELRP
ncbi:MAG TPA: hypothetical protein VN814_19545 [Caulobacteraceae bacterium]|nr:hypothetical protein [Caulobacteraceae bacterium]